MCNISQCRDCHGMLKSDAALKRELQNILTTTMEQLPYCKTQQVRLFTNTI